MSLRGLAPALSEFADYAERAYDLDRESDDPEVLALLLALIRNCRADLQALYHRVEQDLIRSSGSKRFVVPSLGEVEIKKSVKYQNWDNDGLTRRLVAMALDERKVDEETGEYEPAWEAVARVLSECARPSWRVTPLRARHLDIDEYCQIIPDDYSVRLPPRSK